MKSLLEKVFQLEAENNPQPFEKFVLDTDQASYILTTIEVELRTLCPVYKDMDVLKLSVVFKPRANTFIESNTFFWWIKSFEQEELGIEKSCLKVFNAIMDVCNPLFLKVTVTEPYPMKHVVTIRSDYETNY